jgi:hypothetical protein
MRIKKIAAVLLVLVIINCQPALAVDDDEYNGYSAESLVITVGYFGGPYYEKAAFTVEELWAMDVQYLDYTFIDNMPSVVIEHAAGVTLADITDAAGIDLNSVQSFNFWTRDKTSDYYSSLRKTYLIDTPRYCYYSLPDNFDYDEGAGNEYATLDAERVPAMIALGDDWNRALAGASFGSDYTNLNTNTRFRLVFGQTDALEHTASNSAKWIHRIEVTLGGAPTVTMDASVLDGEVGSLLRTQAHVSAADPVIAANAQIEWSSSDEAIATVDENGDITVHAEGRATITARVGDSIATMAVTGKPGETISAVTPENPGIGSGGSGGVIGGTGDGGGSASPAAPARPQNPNAQTEIPSSPLPPIAPGANTITAREISILPPPAAQSSDGAGGIQNWRGGGMSDTAAELPIIPRDNPMIPVMISGAAAFLLAGGGIEYILFKRAVK